MTNQGEVPTKDRRDYYRQRNALRHIFDEDYKQKARIRQQARYQAAKSDPEYREKERVRSAARRADPATRVKFDARKEARSAIASGRLTPGPCEVCGDETVHAHHDDYNKPLSVRWLCRVHHQEHHNQERAAQRLARLTAQPAGEGK